MLEYLLNWLPFPEVSGKIESKVKKDKSLKVNDFYYSFLDGLLLIGVKDSEGNKAQLEVHRNFPLWNVKIYGKENSYAYEKVKEHVKGVCAGRACFPVYMNDEYHGAIPYSKKEIRKLPQLTA